MERNISCHPKCAIVSVLSFCVCMCFYLSFFISVLDYMRLVFDAFAGIQLWKPCPLCRMHIYSTACTCVSLDVFGLCDKGICSIFPCLTVGVLWDGCRGEKVGLRFIWEEVCKEVEGRNNEKEHEREKERKREWKRRGWKGGLQERERQRNA